MTHCQLQLCDAIAICKALEIISVFKEEPEQFCMQNAGQSPPNPAQ